MRLAPALVRRLQSGDESALQATDPYESLLYINSAATSLRVAQQYVADARQELRGGGRDPDGDDVDAASTQYGDWLSLATTLRVGILSADMRHHPVAQTLLGVLEAHRTLGGVHVTVFSMCPDKPDDETQQAVRSQVDSWHDIHASTDEAAAELVADEGVHVLLEMQGHTMHRRPGIVLRRPAPVAISMQGFPASTGIESAVLRYLLADRVVLPPELAPKHLVSEEVVYMPYAFIACGYKRSLSIPAPPHGLRNNLDMTDNSMADNTARRARPEGDSKHASWVDVDGQWEEELDAGLRLDLIVSQLRGVLALHSTLTSAAELQKLDLSVLPRDGSAQPSARRPSPFRGPLVLCANNSAAKVDAAALTLWTNVLRRIPGQPQLRLDGQFQDAKSNLLQEAAARGVDSVDAGRDNTYEDYMRRLGRCELFLDTLTYGAHTVGLDAMYMGLPLMTIGGAQMASRVGASLMTAAGSGLFVEPSLKAYEDAAVAHSSTPRGEEHGRAARLSRSWPKRLPQSLRSSPLFDADSWASEWKTLMTRALRAVRRTTMSGAGAQL